MSFAFIGSTEEVKHLLFGAPQQDEHCRGWRWHLYMQNTRNRYGAVEAELRKMNAERREREDAAQSDFGQRLLDISARQRADHARDERKHEAV